MKSDNNSFIWLILAIVFALLCLSLGLATIINFFCLEFLPGLICLALGLLAGWICHYCSKKI